jgi:thymidylate synthase
MRSSDIWLGWPYDVFTFSMVGAAVAIALRKAGCAVELGDLVLNAGSSHVYETNVVDAMACIEYVEQPIATFHDYAPLDIAEFPTVQAFVEHLKNIADRAPRKFKWLQNLCPPIHS